MEVIKKKICLEDFTSRVPGMIECVNIKDIDSNKNGSWGSFPKDINLWGTRIKYHTLMSLYHPILRTVMNAKYYEYDAKGKKWIRSDFDWRDALINTTKVLYYTTLPTTGVSDRNIIGKISEDEYNLFYNTVSLLANSGHDGIDLISDVNNIIGRIVVPYGAKCNTCGHTKLGTNIKKCEKCNSSDLTYVHETFVPYFVYWKEIDNWINFLNTLKTDNCCERKKYNSYGGDAFLTFLTTTKEKGWLGNTKFEAPTIDIPLLLTASNKSIGQFTVDNVDIVDENGLTINGKSPVVNNSRIVHTVDKSQFTTLRMRRCTVQDDGTKMPFILNKDENGMYQTAMPYKVNYIHNLELRGDKFYGSTITSMVEICKSIETNKSHYLSLIEKLTDEQYEKDKGTLTSPISGIDINQVKPNLIRYGSKDKKTLLDVERWYANDSYEREITLRDSLIKRLNETYPNRLCFKQDFQFDYELIYGVEDEEKSYEDGEGNIIVPIKEEKIYKTHSGTLYVIFSEPQIVVTYVLGAKIKKQNNKLILDETSPFGLGNAAQQKWSGCGIWYRETFPMKKVCTESFLIDGVQREFTYDMIDFSAKEYRYDFGGIDFPRKNYILCEEVLYKAESYKKDATNDTIFRDEKMLGLDTPLKENYDVVFDRGSAAAFEKHFQLSELKTWQDLENYRNGMFLNK